MKRLLPALLACTACAGPQQRAMPASPAPPEPVHPAPAAPAVDAGVDPPAIAEPPPPQPIEIPAIDRLVDDAVTAGKLPGAVVVVGRHSGILFEKAYGERALVPRPEAMTPDTIFDLASLTKPLVTAASIFLLREEGLLSLDERIADRIPEFAAHGKGDLRVRELLLHTSGLPRVTPLGDYEKGLDEAWARLLETKPERVQRGRFLYSDIGYIVLGRLVEKISGQSLDEFARDNFFEPMGLDDTGFRPPPVKHARCAPTEERDARVAPPGPLMIRGSVHDPRAFRLGGVAGNAGLFSTAADLSRIARMLLNGGSLDGTRVLSPESVRSMTTPLRSGDVVRTLGWDMKSPYDTIRGKRLSPRAFGHGGFTGTSLWIDPELDVFVLFLSNRVHPEGHGDSLRLAGSVADAAVEAAGRAETRGCEVGTGRTRTGIDIVSERRGGALAGCRVALLTNASGRARDGRTTFEVLRDLDDVEVIALLTPEHGFGADREGGVADTQLEGIPAYSLFGNQRRPTAAMLKGADTIVFDLQDVGTRFFTYLSTLHQVLHAAVEQGLRVVVLDRPNPLGDAVRGPVLDEGIETFVNYHPLPVTHGMTTGELARLLNSERSIYADLTVVELEGHRRDRLFPDTGLTWYPPSPNLKRFQSALLYPAVGLLESTNLSVGRGTATPFELLGAPWLDAPALVASFDTAALPAVRFEPARFEPTSGPYRGSSLDGVRVEVTDPSAFDPLRLTMELALRIRRQQPGAWTFDDLQKLLGDRRTLGALRRGAPFTRIEALWRDEIADFRAIRAPYLLYPSCSDAGTW